MTQAIGLAVITVATYAAMEWADLHLYWAEFGLMMVAVFGIGAAVARAGGSRAFLKAAATSFMTVLGIYSLVLVRWLFGPVSAQPEILPRPATMVVLLVVLSLMIGNVRSRRPRRVQSSGPNALGPMCRRIWRPVGGRIRPNQSMWLIVGLNHTRTMKVFAILAVFALLLPGGLAATEQSVSEPSPVITDPEAYAVYAAVLPHSVLQENQPEPVAIQLETFPGRTDCPRTELITEEWRAAFDDYWKQNATTKFIRPGFSLGKTYSLIPWAELRQMLMDEGYLSPDTPRSNALGPKVFSRFRGGAVVVLSAVGFNPERTRAMVTVQRNCILKDGRIGCEETHTVGLRKKDGRWDPSGIGCHGIA